MPLVTQMAGMTDNVRGFPTCLSLQGGILLRISFPAGSVSEGMWRARFMDDLLRISFVTFLFASEAGTLAVM